MDCCQTLLREQSIPRMPTDLERQLDQIPKMSRNALQELWQQLFGKPPHPKLRREILIQVLIYRAQEKVLGGLKASTERRLKAIADVIKDEKPKRPRVLRGPQPGTRMVRQWQGRLHEVITLENGFLYDGQKFRSLSEIARLITGARWSGPVFFGLKKRVTREAA